MGISSSLSSVEERNEPFNGNLLVSATCFSKGEGFVSVTFFFIPALSAVR